MCVCVKFTLFMLSRIKLHKKLLNLNFYIVLDISPSTEYILFNVSMNTETYLRIVSILC